MSTYEVPTNTIESETERPGHRPPPPPPPPPSEYEPLSPFDMIHQSYYGTFTLSIYLFINL